MSDHQRGTPLPRDVPDPATPAGPVGEIREAAYWLRQRAERFPRGPLGVEADGGAWTLRARQAGRPVALLGDTDDKDAIPDGAHLALWTRELAEVLADWLGGVAMRLEWGAEISAADRSRALQVARAITGGGHE